MIQDPEYIKKVYKALTSKVEGFNKTPEEFSAALKDEAYVNRVYTALSAKVDGFTKTPEEFKTLVYSPEKKNSNSTGSQTPKVSQSIPQPKQSTSVGGKQPQVKPSATSSGESDLINKFGLKPGEKIEGVERKAYEAQRNQPKLSVAKKQDIVETKSVSKGLDKKLDAKYEEISQIPVKQNKQFIQDFRNATAITPDYESQVRQEVQDELQGKGVWNTITQGASNLWNKVVPYIPGAPFDEKELEKLKSDVTFLPKAKEEYKNSLLKQGIKEEEITDDILTKGAIELEVNKRIEDKRLSLVNDYLDSISDEVKDSMELNTLREKDLKSPEVKRQYDILLTLDKDLEEDNSELLKLEKIAEEQGGLNEEQLNSYNSILYNVKNKIETRNKLYSSYEKNVSDLTTLEEEYDLFKRSYGFEDKAGKLLNAVADFGLGVLQFANMVQRGPTQDLIAMELAGIKNNKDKVVAEKLQKQVEDSENVNDILDYSADVLISQVPNIAMGYLTGGTSMLVGIGVSSTGNKYSELLQSNIEGKTDYSKLQLYLASGLYGGAEMLESNTLRMIGGGKRLISKALKNEPSRKLFKESLSTKTFNTGKEFLKNYKGELKEEFTTFGAQKLTDIVVLDMDSKDVFKNAKEEIKSITKDTGVMVVGLNLFPATMSKVINIFTPKEYTYNLDKNNKRIEELSKILNNKDASDLAKKEAKENIDKIVKTNEEGLNKIIKNTSKLSDDLIDKVIELEIDSSNLRNKANEINNDKSITKKEKASLLSGLKEKFVQNETLREDIITGRKKSFDILPEEESTKLKSKAADELKAEALANGIEEKDIQISEEEVNKRAIENYEKVSTKTTVEKPIEEGLTRQEGDKGAVTAQGQEGGVVQEEVNIYYYNTDPNRGPVEERPTVVPEGYSTIKEIENSFELEAWKKQNEVTEGDQDFKVTAEEGTQEEVNKELKNVIVNSNKEYDEIIRKLIKDYGNALNKRNKLKVDSKEYVEAQKQVEIADNNLNIFKDNNKDLILQHGTPYDFSKFELEKIGTGEGNQAFGYGLYFTEDSKIAKSYADKLSKDKDGLIYTVKIKNGRISNWIEWRDALDDTQAENISKNIKSKSKEYKDYLDSVSDEKSHTGASEILFNDNIQVDERPLQVGAVYLDLKDAFGQQEATRIMQKSGINGVKYRTKGGKGDSFNYVVFDPNSIVIQNKTTNKTETDAIQEQITDEGVLRPEQSEMGLQEVVEGDQGQEVATKQSEEKVIPGTKSNVSGVEITYPTEDEAKARRDERSRPQYVQSAVETLKEEDTDTLKKELEGEFGLLTAENPMAQPLTEEENSALNNKAENWLKSRGYNTRRVVGKYGQAENSFFVPNLSKADAVAFAKEFNQESVAHSEGLIYQDGSVNPRNKANDNFELSENYNEDSDFVSVVNTKDGPKTFSVGYNFGRKIGGGTDTVSISPSDSNLDGKIKDASNQRIAKIAVKAAKALSKVLPNVRIVLHNTNDSFVGISGESKNQSSSGLYQNGEIHINLEKANRRTVAHEVFHAILLDKVKTDSKAADVTKKMIEALTPMLDKNKALKQRLQDFADNYDDNIQNEEKIAEFVGILASNFDSLSGRAKEAVKNWLNSLAKMFGVELFESNEVLDVLNTIAKKVATGKEISKKDISKVIPSDIDKYGNLRKPSELSINNLNNRKQKIVDEVKSKVIEGNIVSTRLPKKNDVHSNKDYIVSLKSLESEAIGDKKIQEQYIKIAKEISSYDISKTKNVENFDDAKKLVNDFKNSVKSNLKWLYNSFGNDVRDVSKLWYDGANVISNDIALKYNYSLEQVAGVMAVLSPQMDWFRNLSLGERVIDIYSNQKESIFDSKMIEYINNATTGKGKNKLPLFKDSKDIISRVKGKKLLELDNKDKAYFIRVFDEVYNPRQYNNISPNGKVNGLVRKSDGTPGACGWGAFSTIEKSISILENGSIENISSNLGNMHKVRNFFNNISNPNDLNAVTIDTHAVAAALLLPLSGSSKQVLYNFGGAGNVNTGMTGTYPVYADAYRELASELGLLPREVQSITWEAVRGLFKATFKTDKNNELKINEVWKDYSSGLISLSKAHSDIESISGGISKPVWFEYLADDNLESLDKNSAAVNQANLDNEKEDITIRQQKALPSKVAEKLTEDGDGNFVFKHYSDQRRDVIKKGQGTNRITSREEASALGAVGGLAMFYTMEGQVESGVGNVEHTILVSKDKVYDIDSDPLGFEKEARKRFNEVRPGQAFTNNYRGAFITQIANENGFDIAVSQWRGGELRAQTTLELKPEKTNTQFKERPLPTFSVGEVAIIDGKESVIEKIEGDRLTYKSVDGTASGVTLNNERNRRSIIKIEPSPVARKQRAFEKSRKAAIKNVKGGKYGSLTNTSKSNKVTILEHETMKVKLLNIAMLFPKIVEKVVDVDLFNKYKDVILSMSGRRLAAQTTITAQEVADLYDQIIDDYTNFSDVQNAISNGIDINTLPDEQKDYYENNEDKFDKPKVEREKDIEKSKEEREELENQVVSLVPSIKHTPKDYDTKSMSFKIASLLADINPLDLKLLSNSQLENLRRVLETMSLGEDIPAYANDVYQEILSNRNMALESNIADKYNRTGFNRIPLRRKLTEMTDAIRGFFGENALTKKSNLESRASRYPLVLIDTANKIFGVLPKYSDAVLNNYGAIPIYKYILSSIEKGEGALASRNEEVAEVFKKSYDRLSEKTKDIDESLRKIHFAFLQVQAWANPGNKKVKSGVVSFTENFKNPDTPYSDKMKKQYEKFVDKYKGYSFIKSNDKLVVLDENGVDVTTEYFSREEMVAYKTIRKELDNQKARAEETSLFNNKNALPFVNEYFPENNFSKTASAQSINDDPLSNNFSKKPSVKSKSLLEKTTQSHPVMHNPFAVSLISIKGTEMQYQLLNPIQVARKTLKKIKENNQKAIVESTGKEKARYNELGKVYDNIDGAIETLVEHLKGANIGKADALDNISDILTNTFYIGALASGIRTIPDLALNYQHLITAEPSALLEGLNQRKVVNRVVNKINKQNPDNVYRQILKYIEASQINRVMGVVNLTSVRSEFQSEGASSDIIRKGVESDASKVWNKVTGVFDPITSKGKLLNEALMSVSDNMPALSFFLGVFSNEFKDASGNNFDWEKAANNDSSYALDNAGAIEHASMIANFKLATYLGSKNVSSKSPVVVSAMRGQEGKILGKLKNRANYMFRQFQMSSTGQFLSALNTLFEVESREDVSKQVRIMVGSGLRTSLYYALSQSIINGIVGLVLGDDEDEEIMRKNSNELSNDDEFIKKLYTLTESYKEFKKEASELNPELDFDIAEVFNADGKIKGEILDLLKDKRFRDLFDANYRFYAREMFSLKITELSKDNGLMKDYKESNVKDIIKRIDSGDKNISQNQLEMRLAYLNSEYGRSAINQEDREDYIEKIEEYLVDTKYYLLYNRIASNDEFDNTTPEGSFKAAALFVTMDNLLKHRDNSFMSNWEKGIVETAVNVTTGIRGSYPTQAVSYIVELINKKHKESTRGYYDFERDRYNYSTPDIMLSDKAFKPGKILESLTPPEITVLMRGFQRNKVTDAALIGLRMPGISDLNRISGGIKKDNIYENARGKFVENEIKQFLEKKLYLTEKEKEAKAKKDAEYKSKLVQDKDKIRRVTK